MPQIRQDALAADGQAARGASAHPPPSLGETLRSLATRPAALRWLGFVGAVLLGISAWVGGALPAFRAGENPMTVLTGPRGPAIYPLWICGTAALCTAWWLGRRHAGTGTLTARWVAITAGLWMLPLLVAPPFGSRDVYAYACQGAVAAAGHNPYIDGASALPCPWLASVPPIWRNTPAPYGPIFVMLANAGARLGSLTASIVFFRLVALAGVVLVALALSRLARRAGVPIDRALWLGLACPLVAEHLIGGAHNDALAIGLLVGGFAMLAIRSRHNARVGGAAAALVAGGVLIGCAVATKATAAVALPFAALYAAGSPVWPMTRAVAARAGAVVLSAVGTVVGLAYGSGLGFGWVKALSHEGDSVVWTSPPTSVGLTIGYIGRLFGAHLHVEQTTRLVALALLPVVLALILWRSRNERRLDGAGLALVAAIFLAPIAQPWYLAWPLVLFAAAAMARRWFFIVVLAASAIELPDGSGFTKILQLPGAILVSAITVWVAKRCVGLVRRRQAGAAPSLASAWHGAVSRSPAPIPKTRRARTRRRAPAMTRDAPA